MLYFSAPGSCFRHHHAYPLSMWLQVTISRWQLGFKWPLVESWNVLHGFLVELQSALPLQLLVSRTCRVLAALQEGVQSE